MFSKNIKIKKTPEFLTKSVAINSDSIPLFVTQYVVRIHFTSTLIFQLNADHKKVES